MTELPDPSDLPDPPDLLGQPDPIELPDLSPDAAWSVSLRDAATGEVLAERTPERLLRTASIGKLFLLVDAARRLESGELDPAEPLAWVDEEWVADSGLWYRMAVRELPLIDVCALVGAVSDNLATNVLVRRLGLPAARERARELGCAESALLDRVRNERTPQTPPTLSVGRADELAGAMVALAQQSAAGDAAATRVLGWLAADTDLSMVAAAFGLDPLAHDHVDRGVHLMNKTGTIRTARIDVGLVRGPDRGVAYAVGANWDGGTGPRDRVLADMRAIGERVRAAVGA